MPRAILSLGVFLGVACGPLAKPREVVIAQQTEPSTFDPHLANEAVVWSTLSNVVEGLVRFSPQLELEPSLALHWEQLSPRSWRFTLRPGVLFHNGKPLSADDVVASFSRAQSHPRSQVRHFLVGVVRVVAEAHNQIILETATPSPTLLRRLNFVLVLPKEQCGLEEVQQPVGTGPFRIVGRNNKSLRLEAVPWWGGTPAVRRAKFIFMDSDEARTEAFLAGRIDVCAWPREADLAEMRKRSDLVVVQQPRLSVQLLALNPEAASGKTRRALADVRVRRALLFAIDRERLVRQVAAGNGTVASQLVHPLVFGYDPAIAPVPYDPKKAKTLLAEAGFAQGFEVELGVGEGAMATAERIAQDWGQVGVRTRITSLPFPQLLAAARGGRMPITFFARTSTTSDASQVLDPQTRCLHLERGLGLENYSYVCDPTLDQLLELASQEVDVEKRRSLLQQAQRRVLEQAYYLPLVIRWGYLGLRRPLQFTPRYDQYLFLGDFTLGPKP